jgi:hypothetical protein
MRPHKISTRTADRLQDEVCRQMLRLEAGLPFAHLLLAVALLQAWLTLEEQAPNCESRQWLRRLTPVCLRMIEEACGTGICSCKESSPRPRATEPEKMR